MIEDYEQRKNTTFPKFVRREENITIANMEKFVLWVNEVEKRIEVLEQKLKESH